MDMVNKRVKHKTLGVGEVTAHAGLYITVEFATKTSKFTYPDAFLQFLTCEDAADQAAILQEIAEAKAKKEALARAEAERKAAEAQQRAALLAPMGKKAKTLDEMFAPDYHAEKLARQPILTYQQVEEQFGIHISGFGRGINPTGDTVVLISSISKASGNFVYHDKWTEDGDYLYSGEGKSGNQTMTKGNLAIRDAARNGKKIHLFVKFSPQEYYYQGIFELADFTYEDEKDENGNTRKEYKFRLRKVEK